MSHPTQSGGCVPAPCTSNQSVSATRLVEWLRNDRFEVNEGSRAETDLAYRHGWNAHAEHLLSDVIPRLLSEQRIDKALAELEEQTR